MTVHFELERDGFILVESLFTSDEMDLLVRTAEAFEEDGKLRGGGRNVFSLRPELIPVFKNKKVLPLIGSYIGAGIGLSEAIYLSKSEAANWLVSWHQDLSISLRDKIDIEGYHPWVQKEGKHYVQPPAEVLERSLWLRINLDPNTEENGCLKAIPGSHLFGKLDQNKINQMVTEKKEMALPSKSGDAILFRPLLLHSSSKSLKPGPRRVFQALYSGYQFQNGLQWPY